MPEEMPIFTRTYDFLSWLIPLTMNLPRSQRFVVTRRLQDAALDFQERIVEANGCRGAARAEKLRAADAELVKVRLYLQVCSARFSALSRKRPCGVGFPPVYGGDRGGRRGDAKR
jgi:hypothetical protein